MSVRFSLSFVISCFLPLVEWGNITSCCVAHIQLTIYPAEIVVIGYAVFLAEWGDIYHPFGPVCSAAGFVSLLEINLTGMIFLDP